MKLCTMIKQHRRHYITTTVTILACGLLILSCGKSVDRSDAGLEQKLARFCEQNNVTILVTDSGLGGLSVMAGIEKNLREWNLFDSVQLVFCNALPDNDHTYNSMESTAEKVRVFNAALTGMNAKYHPDIILIACNTLSVISPQTAFASATDIPVVGIVDFGVDLMYERLQTDSTSVVFILGTGTTIGQNTHKHVLCSLGIAPERIVTQTCDMLESEIQADPSGDITRAMIDMYAYEASEKRDIADDAHPMVGLCCTHYGYAANVFKEAFEQLYDRPVTILDPNVAMCAFLFDDHNRNRFDTTVLNVQVVSQAELSDDDRTAIAAMIASVSPATAEALRQYHREPSLFSF
ncbi:MAG: aspartate/glutamate racemase family protein [candidate division Zixibacteria bacterium]|nr:aspartate/glutamate racemase family protein [candidate division Zixibacteria bacterium]